MRQGEAQRGNRHGQPGGGSNRYGADQKSEGGDQVLVNEATARAILDGDSARLVEVAERLGKTLAEGKLKPSQIRNIFGAVRRIEMSWPRGEVDPAKRESAIHNLRLLKPKLAYQAARQEKQGGGRMVGVLRDNLRPLIDGVGTDRIRFQRFVDFFEATLAYHRAYGGSD